jgi:DNA repair protein RecN (Recombination protein N)
VLTLLKIKNIALIDELSVEFGAGLNLLTGETGSGKSIIVDSLGALTGDRVSNDLIKQGSDSARIEGLFSISKDTNVRFLLDEFGIELDGDELLVKRDLSAAGKNRVFVNDQLITQGLLKRLGRLLVDIHGQGEQTALYDVDTHIGMLDEFGTHDVEKGSVAEAFAAWSAIESELRSLEKDESEKLQLLDILRFQVSELKAASLTPGEDAELEQEKLRLNNVEKLSALSGDVYGLLYENDASTASTLERAMRSIAELAEFDPLFSEYAETLASAQATIQDAALTARNLSGKLEFSPERLNEIESRLAEIGGLKRKYGGTLETVLDHLAETEKRLENIETAEFHAEELKRQLEAAKSEYDSAADTLNKKRLDAGDKFAKAVETALKAVALDKAKFEVRIAKTERISPNGSDNVEFYFSANPGEPPRPLAKVASGGEASRLMLILKTAGRPSERGKTAVFDEIDIGIGGRVAEAVGRKLKDLSATQQVFCVTHQPQIASLADHHFVVEKDISAHATKVAVRELLSKERVDEIARMLAGEQVTDAARENAKAMLAAAN